MARVCRIYLFFLFQFFLAIQSRSQECNIRNRILPSGVMHYYIEAVNFQTADSKRLSGSIITDGEFFYLRLNPFPILSKEQAKKVNGKLKLNLANDSTYELEFFDSHFIGDTVFSVIYSISKEQLEPLVTHNIQDALIDLNEGTPRSYYFNLHSDVIMVQLKCFIEARRKKLFF